jgi:hypothetical protein
MRDPKTDPHPGDVFVKNGRRRTVVTTGPLIRYQTPTNKRRNETNTLRVSLWNKWAQDAEVSENGK